MAGRDDSLYALLTQRGMTRRTFLKFSAAMSAVLALPGSYTPRIAAAVTAAPRIPVIWLEGQDCAGNTEAFLRASHPTVAELVLDTLSVDYHETIMAAAGAQAEAARAATMAAYPNGYIAIVEGSIPVGDNGIYCTVGGRTFLETVREVCGSALTTIAVGSCAFDGGLPAAAGGWTEAIGVAEAVPGAKVINLPGCPMNVQNLTATIVHFLTFKEWPATDSYGRPLFAYGELIHDHCERRAHFERGEYVLEWGDEASRKGWCLYKMGCKGPETLANCPTARFNDGTSWPVAAGHGCVGCTMPGFWDQMSPFYRRLPTVPGFDNDVTANQIGLGLVAGVTTLTAVHAAASYARNRRSSARARAELAAVSEPIDGGGGPGAGSDGNPDAAGGGHAQRTE